MLKRKIAITALGAALMLSTTASMTIAAPRGGADRDGPRMRPEPMFVHLLKVADTNKDGKITKEEFNARQEALFTEIDADKDGSITPKEMRDYRKTKMDAWRAANPKPEKAATEGSEKKAEGDKKDSERESKPRQAREDGKGQGRKGKMGGMFATADTDGNGQLSKPEFMAAGEKIFTRLDSNGDGVISIDDMPDRPWL
ncbi:EF-hand domain-containing protein [uncultured Agrobacterium sp.]|uniref:EF-hand domain-containing protein n=1 Tax=uncultured Agrobacterium sp. TaxID=157277 RepID=UPI0025D07366|nr:EF-hand domain-containing protein [uncultured Agrobacterium sp.]